MTETKTRAEMAASLQKAFPREQIGKLPRGGIQLDYVGHADVTRRLLESDPDWNWEPLATDEHGLPMFDTGQNGQPVGLWIKLTAGGITRLGYGSCPASQGDAVKVLIGDALRNAAMRFGVALDLWAKGDRADPSAENPAGPAGHRAPRDDSWRNQQPVNRRPQAAPANGNGNGHAPAGRTERPTPPAVVPVSATEIDKDAQAFADEAFEALTVPALGAIHARAREAHKLAALICNPATGGNGGLGEYMNYRKGVIEKAGKSLAALEAAGQQAGLDADELERRVGALNGGKGINGATAEEMDKAAALILKGAKAAA